MADLQNALKAIDEAKLREAAGEDPLEALLQKSSQPPVEALPEVEKLPVISNKALEETADKAAVKIAGKVAGRGILAGVGSAFAWLGAAVVSLPADVIGFVVVPLNDTPNTKEEMATLKRLRQEQLSSTPPKPQTTLLTASKPPPAAQIPSPAVLPPSTSTPTVSVVSPIPLPAVPVAPVPAPVPTVQVPVTPAASPPPIAAAPVPPPIAQVPSPAIPAAPVSAPVPVVQAPVTPVAPAPLPLVQTPLLPAEVPAAPPAPTVLPETPAPEPPVLNSAPTIPYIVVNPMPGYEYGHHPFPANVISTATQAPATQAAPVASAAVQHSVQPSTTMPAATTGTLAPPPASAPAPKKHFQTGAFAPNHNLLKTVTFAINSAALTDKDKLALDQIAEEFSHAPAGSVLDLYGHASTTGGVSRDQELSAQRVANAKDYLIKQHHIDPSRIISQAYGKTKNLVKATGDNVECESNRSVTYKIAPPAQPAAHAPAGM